MTEKLSGDALETLAAARSRLRRYLDRGISTADGADIMSAIDAALADLRAAPPRSDPDPNEPCGWPVSTCRFAENDTAKPAAGRIADLERELESALHQVACLEEVVKMRADGGSKAFEEKYPRVIKNTDSYCPSCGHNRDTSSVSSIDNDDGTHYCQKCSAEWREVP